MHFSTAIRLHLAASLNVIEVQVLISNLGDVAGYHGNTATSNTEEELDRMLVRLTSIIQSYSHLYL